jgi:hypothetical protein
MGRAGEIGGKRRNILCAEPLEVRWVSLGSVFSAVVDDLGVEGGVGFEEEERWRVDFWYTFAGLEDEEE